MNNPEISNIMAQALALFELDAHCGRMQATFTVRHHSDKPVAFFFTPDEAKKACGEGDWKVTATNEHAGRVSTTFSKEFLGVECRFVSAPEMVTQPVAEMEVVA